MALFGFFAGAAETGSISSFVDTISLTGFFVGVK